MTRYLENRDATMRRLDKQLPHAAYEVLEDQTEAGLDAAIARLSGRVPTCIVIDTPGRDDPIARAAILKADTLVTPMNDSFVDLDLIGQVHPENFKVTKPSFYAELIWNSRTQRAKATGKSVDWVVLRNRLQHIESHNLQPRRRRARRAGAPRRLPGHPRPWRARHLPRALPQGPDPARPCRPGRSRPWTHCRPSGVARDDRGPWPFLARPRSSERPRPPPRAEARQQEYQCRTSSIGPSCANMTFAGSSARPSTPTTPTALGRSYAALATSEGAKRVAVGRDGRTHSPELEAALVEGLTEGGLDVVRIGMGPSPMLYFAVSTLDVDGGIQVTGSHNPADYNGFKMLLNGRSVFGAEIQDLGRRAAEGDWSEGAGHGRGASTSSTPMSMRWSRASTARPTGSAGTRATAPAARCSRSWSSACRASITRSTPRSTARFPNHHPDPTVEANLADLKKLVADKNLDFGIAFDGDADRIGAVDGKGRVIWGDQLLIILAGPVLKDLPGATIIADVKASQTLFDRIAEMGGKPLMWKTGHSLIKSKMKETGAPLAGEMSGHIFFKHQWYGFDDALYAAVRLIRAVSASGKSLTELKSEMPVSVATPELRFQVDESRKFAVDRRSRRRASPPKAPRSTRPTACASRPPTAGGCCAPRTPRTCSSPAPRRKDQAGLDRLMATVNAQLEASGIAAVEAAH